MEREEIFQKYNKLPDEEKRKFLFRLGRNAGKSNICFSLAKYLIQREAAQHRLQPTAFGASTQAEFPLLDGNQADEPPATIGGG